MKKQYFTIKLKKCGTIHICYIKDECYVAPNHFHKWKINSDKIELL